METTITTPRGTINTYLELRDKQQKEVNSFPMFFAFDNKQFNEGMKKLGLEPADTDKIYRFGDTGGYYRKSDADTLHEMLTRHHRELHSAIQNDKAGDGFIYDMFDYELGNHEYCITYDVSDTLDSLGLTAEEIDSNRNLQHGLEKACKTQRQV